MVCYWSKKRLKKTDMQEKSTKMDNTKFDERTY